VIDYLHKIFDAVEKDHDRITTIWMGPQCFADLRKSAANYPNILNLMAFLELVTEREVIKSGHVATLWGAEVRLDPKEQHFRYDTQRTKNARPSRWDIIGA
jgi:hypothetical protein